MKLNCEKCSVKIHKRQQFLRCNECEMIKHFKCQKLSKVDARKIADLRINWTCFDCILNILPVNAVSAPRSSAPRPQFKVQCYSCLGYCYSPSNIKTCHFCEQLVHAKCHKNYLGCVKCCEEIIPGFHISSYELFDDFNRINLFYNPYNRENFVNILGDMIENNDQNDSTWSKVSDFLISCKYKQHKHVAPPSNNNLKVFSHNIRSLKNNVHKIREDLSSYENYDILSFNETNCKMDQLPHGIKDLLIDGFHEPFFKPPSRKSGKGGGLIIYVNKRVGEFEDFEPFDPNPVPENSSAEFQFIKLHKCKGYLSTKILVNVYRSPSKNLDSFIILLDQTMRSINRHSKKHVIFTGDINCDLLKYENNLQAQKLVDTMAQYGFLQLVSRPTRITDSSATLIDHVYTNKLENTLSCNIITTSLSDHLGIVTTIALDSESGPRIAMRLRENNPINSLYREINEANHEKFRELISDETWEGIFAVSDVSEQYNKFHGIYMKHYDFAYPMKKKKVGRRKNERKNSKPWILPWLEDAIARKQNLYHEYIKEFVKNPSTADKTAYNKLEKFCCKHVDLAKKRHYKKFFEEHKENSRKQWQMINSLLNRNNKKSDPIKLHDCEGNLITSSVDVASHFNKYFSSIASNLKEKISARKIFDPGGYQKFLTNSSENSFYIRTVNSSEVHNTIKDLKNKATLDSKICALKIANENHDFTEVLSKIVNNSFQKGCFPEHLKTARVVPIHKEGSKTDVANYRPISLLSSFSKIYEKLMHKRVLEFLDRNNSLYEMQYGFRPGRSCEHALLNAQNTILNSLSRKQVSLLLLIDFSKAFDMVDHSILLAKLHHYGIRGIAHKWFESYLKQRNQFVSVNGADSGPEKLLYGVPQGSILGPLLFIIYINDLPGIYKFAKFILYADDANILITGSSVEEVYEMLKELSHMLTDWVDHNGLALNLKKTKYMVFTRQRNFDEINFTLLNTKIERKSEARFLGVIVDDKLTWSKHITVLKSKLARYLGVMYQIKRSLPISARLQIYHSFVQAHLNYCSLIWGFAAKSHIDAIFSKQKAGIRAIMEGYVNYWYRDGKIPSHTKSTFNSLEILTVHGIIVRNALIFMHKMKYFSSSLPQSIASTVPPNAPNRTNIHEDNLAWLNIYGEVYYRRSVFNKGPLLAISPQNIDVTSPACLLNIKAYKNCTKNLILSLQKQGDTEEWATFWLNDIRGLRKSNRNK